MALITLSVSVHPTEREPQREEFPVVAVYLHGKNDVTVARQNYGFPDVIFYHLGMDDNVPINDLRIKTDELLEKPLRLEHLCYTNDHGKYVQDITIHVHSIYDINFVGKSR